MPFTEFYCNAVTGSNLNSGDTEGAVEITALAGTYSQGGGAGGNDRFTAASGTPFAALTANTRFASFKAASGASPADFLAFITAVNGGGSSIDLSLTKISGTRPANGSSQDCRVGGALKGPNGAEAFPFAFITNALTNLSGDVVRINFKNNATYAVTSPNTITPSKAGAIVFSGYGSTPGDLLRAVIDGGTSGAGYTLVNITQGRTTFESFVFQNNGSSGQNTGVSHSSQGTRFFNCVFNSFRGSGLSGSDLMIEECEAYGCNQGGAGNGAGINITAGCAVKRCISHDNSGAGFNGSPSLFSEISECIADSNSGAGFSHVSGANLVIRIVKCESYNNGSHGIEVGNGPGAVGIVEIENCNLIKNTGYGINVNGSNPRIGRLLNNGFGQGAGAANSSGTTNNLGGIIESGSILYPSGLTPWVDPANGDFRINLPAAKGTGRGMFVQTATSYAGTVGFPDVGASQHTAVTIRRPTENLMIVSPGTNSISAVVEMFDEYGQPVLGLVANTFGTMIKRQDGAFLSSSQSLVDLSALTDAWTAGGIKEIGNGRYRFDVPNLSTAGVASTFRFWSESTGKRMIPLIVQYSDVLLNSVPGTYPSGSAGYALGRIGSGQIEVTGIVVEDGNATIFQGDSYLAVDGRAIEWTNTGVAWPSLAGAVVTFNVNLSTGSAVVTGSPFAMTIITPDAPNQKVRLELTAAQTGAFPIDALPFAIKATLADASIVTLLTGSMLVKPAP